MTQWIEHDGYLRNAASVEKNLPRAARCHGCNGKTVCCIRNGWFRVRRDRHGRLWPASPQTAAMQADALAQKINMGDDHPLLERLQNNYQSFAKKLSQKEKNRYYEP